MVFCTLSILKKWEYLNYCLTVRISSTNYPWIPWSIEFLHSIIRWQNKEKAVVIPEAEITLVIWIFCAPLHWLLTRSVSCPASSVNGEANSWLSEITRADMTLEILIPFHTKTSLQYSRPCSFSISHAHVWAYRFFPTPWMKGTCDEILSCFLEGISHQYKLFIRGTHIIYAYFQITYSVIVSSNGLSLGTLNSIAGVI